MAESLIDSIRENVIQGRVTREDEGLEEGMVGQPAVTEFVAEALAQALPDVATAHWNKGNASIPANDEILGEIEGRCQAVVAAYGH